MEITKVKTYAELLAYLSKMTPEQLAQVIQSVKVSATEITTCNAVVGIGEIDSMNFYRCRSSYDNKYHGKDIALLVCPNNFGEDGAEGYRHVASNGIMNTKEFREKMDLAFKDIKIFKEGSIPLYGKNGPTKVEDQINPKYGLCKHDQALAITLEASGIASSKDLKPKEPQPPVEMNLRKDILRVIKDAFFLDHEDISEDTHANKVFADEIDRIEIVFEFEDEYEISLDDDPTPIFKNVKTVSDIITIVEKAVHSQKPKWTKDIKWVTE